MFDPFPELPHVVRNYKLTSVIGKGGYGVVYKATNLNYNIDFAVKVIFPNKAHRFSNASTMDNTQNEFIHKQKLEMKLNRTFDAEVRALLKLDHPHVIRLYDFFRENDYMFLVLEYCSGGSLEDRIKANEPMSDECKINICYQIISALKYCYDMNIAHRDIKAANVLFDSTGRIKVADFGLSQLMSDHDDNLNQFDGSLYYAAPEIYRKVSFNPFKSDIWALGVLFFRLFTYEYPFYMTNRAALKNQVLSGLYRHILTGKVAAIIKNMLVVDPGKRLNINDLASDSFFTPLKLISKFPTTCVCKSIILGPHLRRHSHEMKSTSPINSLKHHPYDSNRNSLKCFCFPTTFV